MPDRILHCSQAFMAFLAGTSGVLASITAGLPEADRLEAIGKWPLTIVLGFICCFCVYIIYRQGADYRKSLDALTASNNRIAQLLSERPCIRPRTND